MMRVKEYIASTTLPFILNDDIDSHVPWKTSDFQSTLKDYINIHYGSLRIRRSFEESDDIASFIKYMCSNTYRVNSYKYQHLYDTTIAVYDPIENYRMVETEESEHSEEEEGSFTKGSQSNTGSFTKGEITNAEERSLIFGEHTEDRDIDYNKFQTNGGDYEVETRFTEGKRKTTVTQSQDEENQSVKKFDNKNKIESTIHEAATDGSSHFGSTRSTEYNLPFDNVGRTDGQGNPVPLATYASKIVEDYPYRDTTQKDAFVDEEKAYLGTIETTTETEMIDIGLVPSEDVTKEKHPSYKDNEDGMITFSQQTNTEENSFTEGERIDSRQETEGERTDSDSKEVSGTASRTLTRSGNIGVTTSQQMIESEREVALFNFYNVVAKDILKLISTRVYGGC